MGLSIRRIRRDDIGDVAHHEHSPGRASKMTSGETRESQQPITMISGSSRLRQFAEAALLARQPFGEERR